jgi:hypothetical protein
MTALVEHLISQVAVTSKNPRVKQLVLEKAENMIME